MKFVTLTFIALFGLPNVARAATFAESNTGQTVGTSAIPGENGSSNLFFTAGAGLAVTNGNYGWAVNIGTLSEVVTESNLFVGADLGINVWNFENTGAGRVNTSTRGIQLLPSAIYRFQISGSLFPYVGASVGPHVSIVNFVEGGVAQSETDLQFELLLRPGFFAYLGKTVSLQVEGKLGVLNGDFIFLPQANAVFAL